MNQRRALIVEQDPAALAAVEERFSADGWEIDAAATFAGAIGLLELRRYSIIITDQDLASRPDARDLAERVRKTQPGAVLVLVAPDPGGNPHERRLGIQLLLAQPVALDQVAEFARRMLPGSASGLS